MSVILVSRGAEMGHKGREWNGKREILMNLCFLCGGKDDYVFLIKCTGDLEVLGDAACV